MTIKKLNMTATEIQAWQVVKQRNKEVSSLYDDASAMKLGRLLRKKMTNITIGALAILEEYFPEICSKENDRWRRARTKILDNGHLNIRAVENEMAQYSVRWNRYQKVFKVQGANE